MITGSLTTTEHGCVARIQGSEISVDWDIIKGIASSYDYRTHLTLWSDDCERAFVELVGSDINPNMKLSIGSGTLKGFHFGKIHVRGLDGYAEHNIRGLLDCYGSSDSPSNRLKTISRYVADIRSEVQGLGLPKPKGTGAATAHEIWRTRYNPSGRWRCPQAEGSTEKIDFLRRGLYGGQTLASVKGCIYTPGHMPRSIVKNLDCPAFETPPGHKIWRLDARSAYPSAMRMDLPSPWYGISDTFDLDVYKHGVAEVELIINQDGPRVIPVRVRSPDGVKTIWPRAGVVTGVYSYTLLREAVKHGAQIDTVHHARSYSTSRYPLKQFVYDIWRAQASIKNKAVSKTIKSFSRRLNGRFAVSRWKTELVPLSEYMGRLESDPHAPLPKQIVGDYCVTRYRADSYPAYSQVLWSTTTIDRSTVILSRMVHDLDTSGCRVLYTDTDSVMFIARDLGGLPDVPDTVRARMGSGLGQWRVDWCGDWAVIFGQKFYATDSSCTFSGVPDTIQDTLLKTGRAQYRTRQTLFTESRTINYRLKAGKIEAQDE